MICRASTQPAFPSRVRTRYQSSVGGGAAGVDAVATTVSPGRSVARGRESSTQFGGREGGGGSGGGGSLPCLGCFVEAFLLDDTTLLFAFKGAAAGITATRGDTRCNSTSTTPFSGICVKLGACRLGAVCTLRESYTV